MKKKLKVVKVALTRDKCCPSGAQPPRVPVVNRHPLDAMFRKSATPSHKQPQSPQSKSVRGMMKAYARG